MVNIKTKIYSLVKVWIPVLLIPIIVFTIFNKSSSYLTSSILQLLLGVENKDLILEICSYLNTSISLIFSFVIILQILIFFRKTNNEKIFNANGNIYYDHWYITFWMASQILGYSKIQLAGIPIGMQFKIVLRGTFSEIIEDVWDAHYENSTDAILREGEGTVEVEKLNMDSLNISSDVNLLICDTYLIDIDQISDKFKNNPTILIKSTVSKDQLRYLNKELVNEVRKSVQLIARDKNVYIFSTANPKNNLNIITSCFRFFDRFPIKKLYVVQYGKDKKYRDSIRVI